MIIQNAFSRDLRIIHDLFRVWNLVRHCYPWRVGGFFRSWASSGSRPPFIAEAHSGLKRRQFVSHSDRINIVSKRTILVLWCGTWGPEF